MRHALNAIRRFASQPSGAVTVFAFSLFSMSIALERPETLIANTELLIGNAMVGTYAAVDPNPYNTLAGQLTEKERELIEREALLRAAEEDMRERSSMFNLDLSTFSFVASIVLFVLILINFAWDFRRRKSTGQTVARSPSNARGGFQISIRK